MWLTAVGADSALSMHRCTQGIELPDDLWYCSSVNGLAGYQEPDGSREEVRQREEACHHLINLM